MLRRGTCYHAATSLAYHNVVNRRRREPGAADDVANTGELPIPRTTRGHPVYLYHHHCDGPFTATPPLHQRPHVRSERSDVTVRFGRAGACDEVFPWRCLPPPAVVRPRRRRRFCCGRRTTLGAVLDPERHGSRGDALAPRHHVDHPATLSTTRVTEHRFAHWASPVERRRRRIARHLACPARRLYQ